MFPSKVANSTGILHKTFANKIPCVPENKIVTSWETGAKYQ